MNIHEDLIEDGPLTDDGRRILEWLATNANKLDRKAMGESPEPFWNALHQAEEALGIGYGQAKLGDSYLGYAIQQILEDEWP